jgi:hypothetical protein
MRRHDHNAGWIKVLLIVALLLANVLALELQRPGAPRPHRNDEIRNPNRESMTNDEAQGTTRLVIRSSSSFRASSFEFPH